MLGNQDGERPTASIHQLQEVDQDGDTSDMVPQDMAWFTNPKLIAHPLQQF